MGEFYPILLGRLPAWDKQDDLDRHLVALLDGWERQATREGRSAAAEALRALAREAVNQAR